MNKHTYKVTNYLPTNKRSMRKIPAPLRALFIGSSNSGKTTLLMNFIYKNWSTFKYLYIFSRSLNQPLYSELMSRCATIENEIGEQICYAYDNCEDLISVEECNNDSFVVFDDCLLEKQKEIKNYFTRSRHKHISTVYLSQCYNLIDRQTIRNNVNFLCIFVQNKHYVKNIYDDFVGSDMSYHDFVEMCEKCWSLDHGFITIDLTKKPCSGKYKNQLDDMVID